METEPLSETPLDTAIRPTRYAPEGMSPFVLYGPTNDQSVFGQIDSSGEWEPHLVAALRRLVRPDFSCVDVGANIGAITLVLARLAHRVTVHAFEASAESVRLLRRNISENLLTNVVVMQRAVAERTGETVELYTTAGQLGTAHLTTGLGRTGDSQQVQTIALDDYPLFRVDLMKIDIQGSDIAAIKGARNLIEKHRPILIVEHNPAPAAWFAGVSERALYDTLTSLYDNIAIISQGGVLVPVPSWEALDAALPAGAWCDLLCTASARTAAN